MRNPLPDYYAILGVHPTAEDIVIRAAYKALAQRYHPDRFVGSKDEAHRRMSDLTEAYEVLADPVRRPKYDRRRMTYTRSVAATFNSSPKYASLALDPGDLRSTAANRGTYRVALAALMIVVVVLSAFNLFHYSTRLDEWQGTTLSAGSTTTRAETRSGTDAAVVGAVGTVLDDSPPTASMTKPRNLPITQANAATAYEAAMPRAQPPTLVGRDSAAAAEKLLAKGSGNVPARQPVAATSRPAAAPVAVPPADAPLLKEKIRAGARSVPIDRSARSQSTAAATDPCRDAVAALGLCSPHIIAKNK